MTEALHSALLLAAGSGQRMGGAVADKMLVPLKGDAVIAHSVRTFQESGCVRQICLLYRDLEQRAALEKTLDHVLTSALPILWVQGGASRQDSVHRGLEAIASSGGLAFIHDGARPCITAAQIQQLAQIAGRDGAACLARPLTDTVKRLADPNQLHSIELEDLDRERLWAMDPPQVFPTAEILETYPHVVEAGLCVTDDVAAAATIGIRVTLVPNERPNPKITHSADLNYLEWLFSQ